jgi:hypothetical protein
VGKNGYNLTKLSHISIDAFRDPVTYKFPQRNITPKPLRDDYATHAAKLIRQLTAALGDLPAPVTDPRIHVEGLKRGTLVEIATVPPEKNSRTKVTKVPAALEFKQEDIVVLQSRRNENRTEKAVLFVPDGARDFLLGRITDYGRGLSFDQPRPDIEKFEKIEEIRAVTIQSLFVGDIDLALPDPVWWEVWIREPGNRAEAIARAACAANLDVHADKLGRVCKLSLVEEVV